ncbi:phosphotransferase [Nesterenkonia ebinurensis]|uniref:phosphotransferase n=1 Tax=Nesterenkonia ebinurensis TaxID=2608252 RepID=UPI00168BA9FB|nr:phosphotransferase [Nesterenkonia ebinurensis]
MNWEVERLLRSAQMEVLLQTALGSSGLCLEDWSLDRVYSRPHAESSARFQVLASGHQLTLVASTRQLTDEQRDQLGAVRCESAAGSLHIWAHPTDPELPGLRVVEDHAQLAQRLAPLLQHRVRIEQTELVVLRPLRRAVYRVVAVSELGYRRLFLKVVRPQKMPELLARHLACSLIPSTADLGDGILAVDQAPGVTLTDLLYLPSSPLPGIRIDPQVILRALDSLSAQALQLPARTAPPQRFASFGQALIVGGAHPDRVHSLMHRIQAQLRPHTGPLEPTHGDFHPANLFLTDDAASPAALIDGDTVGPGHRIDDVTMMFAHLLALPSYDAAGYSTVPQLVHDLWCAVTMGAYDPADLVARTAASMMALAPGARGPEQLDYYLGAAEHILGCGIISVPHHIHSPNM